MGKLSRNLLSALLLPLVQGDSNFEVTSCNEEVVIEEVVIQRPALSLRILQSYFENNLSGQEDGFELENGYYKRKIPGADLQMEFDEEEDGKLAKFYLLVFKSSSEIQLSYTLATNSPGFDVDEDTRIR